ncbi:Insulin-degrading enzyme [Astathelohania contejeani]|uniref:Insulin-degrading enzyme n=1 Tax=Astathelohania contejeani TaxID=164912 RepID=A0ABQ7HYS9_9MICR|nr:Insulin-degrading enzyme [Thelohania contejeani]
MKIQKAVILLKLLLFLNLQSAVIHKSTIDPNTYEYHFLMNGMTVLTISNPESNTSACSMTVGIGSQNDPTDTPGIAHFLEHLLFMGTKSYSGENEFSKYISNNNGSENAYTDDEHTVFYYSIDPNCLEESLKRFSEFFLCPLLKVDSIKKEMMAVNSEYQDELKNDHVRINQMVNMCIKDIYLPNKFSCGNKETLDKKEIRDILIEFYKNHYNANKMCLVIYGNKSNNELFNFASKYFSAIDNMHVNCHESRLLSFNRIFESKFIGKVIKIKPIGKLSILMITIFLPSKVSIDYKFNVYDFIIYILKKENKGSLIHKLKSEKYIVSSAFSTCSLKLYYELKIQFGLTQKGLNNYLIIFEILATYIKDNIHSTDSNSFCIDEYKKLKYLKNKEFAYMENKKPISLCKRLGINTMINVDIEHLLNFKYLFSKYDAALLLRILNAIANRKNWLVMLIDESIYNESLASEEKEKYYNILYKVEECPIISSYENLYIEHGDCINYDNSDFIDDYNYIPLPVPNSLPDSEIDLVFNNGELRYVFTNNFKTPKSCIYILFKSQNNLAIQKIFSNLVLEFFKTKNEPYEFFFDYKFSAASDGLTLYLYGFNSDIIQIAYVLIDIIQKKTFNEESFNTAKFAIANNIKGNMYNSPRERLFEGVDMIFDPAYISPENVLIQLNELKFNDLEVLIKEFNIEMFVCGNLLYEEAYNLFVYVCNTFKTDNIILPLMENKCQYKDPIIITSYGHDDNACGVFYNVGNLKEYELIGLAKIFINYANEKFFDTLRTEESFGYHVFCDNDIFYSNFFISFLIQSKRKNEEINKRIKTFFNDALQNMTIKDFEISKKAIISHIEYKSLNTFACFLWNMKMHKFWDENIIRCIEKLKFEDIYKIGNISDILIIYVQPKNTK